MPSATNRAEGIRYHPLQRARDARSDRIFFGQVPRLRTPENRLDRRYLPAPAPSRTITARGGALDRDVHQLADVLHVLDASGGLDQARGLRGAAHAVGQLVPP